MTKVRLLIPEIIAEHARVTPERPDFCRLANGRKLELDTRGFVDTGPGPKLLLHHASLDAEQQLARSREKRFSIGAKRVDDGDRSRRQNDMVVVLPDSAGSGERELKKIKAERRCRNHHARAILHRIDRQAAELGLAMPKIETTLPRQISKAMLRQDTADVVPSLLKLAGTKRRVAPQQSGFVEGNWVIRSCSWQGGHGEPSEGIAL